MKVYILSESHGQWEDACDQIIGIFLDRSKAEKIKSEIELEMKEYENKECPYDIENYDNLTLEQQEECDTWQSNYYHARNFNYCSIEEHELIE
jgi:Zn-finger nucleic acid-binding protein